MKKRFCISMRIREVGIVCKHQIKNNNGPNIDPCGTPHFISTEDVFLLLKLVNCFRLFR